MKTFSEAFKETLAVNPAFRQDVMNFIPEMMQDTLFVEFIERTAAGCITRITAVPISDHVTGMATIYAQFAAFFEFGLLTGIKMEKHD